MAEFYTSEACFRQYEEPIIKACLLYPKEVFFSCEGRKPSTVEARCRDAITSFKCRNWTSHIDAAAYAPVLNDIRPITFMGYVVIVRKTIARRLLAKWKLSAKAGEPYMPELVADSMFYAQRIFENEVKSAGPFPAMRSHLEDAELELKPEPQMTHAEFLALDIEQAVELINEGKVQLDYTCELNETNLSRVRAAIGDKLNVAHVLDSSNNQIKIF